MTVGSGQILLAMRWRRPRPPARRPRQRSGTRSSPTTATCSAMPRARSCRAPDGREIVDSSEMRLQELGDPARRVVERTVTRQDATGPGGLDRRAYARWARPGRGSRRGSARTKSRSSRQTPSRTALGANRASGRGALRRRRRAAAPAGTRPRRRGSNSTISTSTRWSSNRSRSRRAPGAAPDAGGQDRGRCASATTAAELQGGGAAAARSRAPRRRRHPADVRHQHHDPDDRPRDGAAAASASIARSRNAMVPLALSGCPARGAAGPYPLPLHLPRRASISRCRRPASSA